MTGSNSGKDSGSNFLVFKLISLLLIKRMTKACISVLSGKPMGPWGASLFYFTYFTLIHDVVGLSLFIDPGFFHGYCDLWREEVV